MKKNNITVISSFIAIALVTTASSFLYQKQVYAAEQSASKIEKEEKIAYEKEQERLTFVAKLAQQSEIARLKKEKEAEKKAAEKAAAEFALAEKARIQEQDRIAAIVDKARRQHALEAAAKAEAERLAEVQKRAQDVADQLAAQKKIAAKIAKQKALATEEALRYAAAKAAAKKRRSRRSRAS